MKQLAFVITLAVLFLVLGGGGFSLISGYAQGVSSGDFPADLPPRPTPVLSPTPGSETPTPSPGPVNPPFPIPSHEELAGPQLSELHLELSSDRIEARYAEKIRFVILLTNTGQTKASKVEVLGLMPHVLDVLETVTTQGSVNINSNNNRIKVSVSALQPGESITITILTQVNGKATSGQKYYTVAKVCQGGDRNPDQQFSNWVPILAVGE
jgi:uncharacterized repeat protein (TIGR01451 family)